jgi:hypothetical protein
MIQNGPPRDHDELQGKKAAGLPKPGAIDFLPFGLAACRPGF